MLNKNFKPVWLPLFLLLINFQLYAQNNTADGKIVTFKKSKAAFPLSDKGKTATIFIDNNEDEGVKRAIIDLQADIKLVTGTTPKTTSGLKDKYIVIAGTIGKNTAIDKLISSKKLNVDDIKGSWENHIIQVIKNPFPGVENALVIAGSDKRGTIYGIYTLSEQIGVSPWYWWADVPVINRKNIYINAGRFSQGSPKVKYRGIFLNDEAPALSGWSKEKFGGFNHKFYEKVFELILRLKGNYLWPAMWGSAFYDDDPQNAVFADKYGIVIGTSHHEPLTRAHDEWRRYGKGAWNYNTNPQNLQNFWRDGIKRMGDKESIVTVGMRGDGDEPMSEDSNISLLEKIVADQRNIIQSVTGKDASKTPQLWALYKEVQDYYDKGMRVPDDITLLLCDDNWGNIRKLPALDAAPRKGGYGVYYHFDYVGGPRNYKWINTNPISKVWEQMNLAYQHNAKEIWIVNVGDLKPMEFPISFFLDYAWNPEKISADDLADYTTNWAKKQFGEKYALEIAGIISEYTKFNGRRKPELLNQNTYSLTHHNEFERVVNEYIELRKKAEGIYHKLDKKYHDAYYQLVMHPVEASANLNQLYLAVAKNHLYAKQKRVSANDEAEKAKAFFKRDAEISNYYNDTLSNGKWKHFMDQTHIGYTFWQQPEKDKMPNVISVTPSEKPLLAGSISGSADVWPASKFKAVLPEFNKFSNRKYYIDLINQGSGAITYSFQTPAWIILSSKSGTFEKEARLWISVDWSKVPAGNQLASITVKGDDNIEIPIHLNIKDHGTTVKGFIPEDNVISIEASNFTNNKASATAQWKLLPNYGRTGSAVTPFPVTAKAQVSGENDSPVLEYTLNLSVAGNIKVATYLAPSLDFNNTGGLKYAVSINDEKPQIVNINSNKTSRAWDKNVGDNINVQYTTHQVKSAGVHTLKIWMVDPAIVIQKLVVSDESYKENTYLGPPESAIAK